MVGIAAACLRLRRRDDRRGGCARNAADRLSMERLWHGARRTSLERAGCIGRGPLRVDHNCAAWRAHFLRRASISHRRRSVGGAGRCIKAAALLGVVFTYGAFRIPTATPSADDPGCKTSDHAAEHFCSPQRFDGASQGSTSLKSYIELVRPCDVADDEWARRRHPSHMAGVTLPLCC